MPFIFVVIYMNAQNAKMPERKQSCVGENMQQVTMGKKSIISHHNGPIFLGGG